MGAIKYLHMWLPMRSVFYLVALFCCGIAQNDAWDAHFAYYDGPIGEECRVEDNFSSPFTTALYERVSIADGCASQERTADGREVHVINVLNGDSSSQSEITLQLTPRDTTGAFNGRMVIILNSQRRVVWKLETDVNMLNASRHLFWISADSKLKKKKNMRIKINKYSMPSPSDELVSWVRSRDLDGAMTSYTEVTRANTIKKYVGIDLESPARCDVSSSTAYQPEGVAMYQQTAVTKGCVALLNENYNNKDVHVIEVEESEQESQSSPHVTDVLVDISARAKRSKQKNLFLVLKSHSQVRWKIITRQLRGTIHIISEDDVDTSSVYMQSISTAVERLGGLTGQQLVDWTRDRYSPVLSYTGAQLANRFHVTVDGADEARLSIIYPEDDDEHNVTEEKKPRNPFETPGKTKVAILTAKSVDCQTQGIQVALRKSTLQAYGVRREHLTLNDETCVARENATHYILETKFNECKTKMSEFSTQVVYENAVFVRKRPDLIDIDLELGDLSGSGYDVIPDDLFLDDEDLVGNIDSIKVDFACPYGTGRLQPEIPTVDRDTVDYSINLYDNSNYEGHLVDFPHLMQDSTSLYVETQVHGEQYLKVVVETCWVTDSQVHNFSHKLVDQECAVDNSFEWLTVGPSQRQKFSFVFHNYFDYSDNDVNVYVMCQLTACATHRIANVQQCNSQRPVCRDGTLRNVTLSAYTKIVHRGPLVMSRRRAGTINHRHPTNNPLPKPDQRLQTDPPPCTAVVQVQGLDSTTVVGIAFAAFLIGVVLMATLWLIHRKTSRKGRHRARFAETSGESTPSSTAPIAIHQVHHH